jgi:acyl-[acyl-carrier-protein] desaturase
MAQTPQTEFTSPSLLSRAERHSLINRTFMGLYRWYMYESQKRTYNPDLDFQWQKFRPDHEDDVITVMEGFFAVEQYVPDYASKITHLVRRLDGRSYFQLQWGAEEAKHSLLWENALLFSKRRSPTWMENYRHDLRSNEWPLPWDDPLHMLVYTVFQERATQLNYVNLGEVSRGLNDYPAIDPVLSRVCSVLVTDEVAHFHFFLEGLRLYLYYFPAETLEAILTVLEHFAMPAQAIIPNWNEIAEAIYRLGVYSPRDFSRKVVGLVFHNLGLHDRKLIEKGLQASRAVPDETGAIRNTAIWDAFCPTRVESGILRLTSKVQHFEHRAHRDTVDNFEFVRNPLWPAHESEGTK